MQKNLLPTPLERQTLSVLYRLGSCSVNDVLEHMDDGKQRAYTTILTVLQNLHHKGFIDREKNSRAHYYNAEPTRAWLAVEMQRELIDQFFNGDACQAVLSMLSHESLPDEELNQIVKYIKTHTTMAIKKPAPAKKAPAKKVAAKKAPAKKVVAKKAPAKKVVAKKAPAKKAVAKKAPAKKAAAKKAPAKKVVAKKAPAKKVAAKKASVKKK